MPDPNYISEIEREDGTVLTIKDAEARAAISEMDPTLQQILQGVNDIKSSIGDVGEIVEEVLAGPPTLIEKTITENGTYDAEDDDADGYSSVTVDVAGGGGGGSLSDDVIFFDYDGSVVASYSAADFANLTAMPANPTHTGLTAQGWNWSLADAKTYVAKYGKLNVGQMYITSDGKTRFYFTVPKEYLEVYLHLVLNENAELDIDWGDGTEHTTWTYDEYEYDKSHTYASAGRYVIAITVVTGSFEIGDENSEIPETLPGIYKAELGSGVTVLAHAAFYVDSGSRFIYSLTSITMPNTITSIGDTAFGCCSLLRFITIPSGVTSIDASTFNECSALEHIAIPNTITRIGTYAFYKCGSLSSLTLPNGLETIDDYALMDCELLSFITIPNGVTSLEGLYFYDLLRDIVFGPSIPPVNGGSSKFNDLSKTCIIHVPQGSLSAYTSATYYPNSSEYIYEEY